MQQRTWSDRATWPTPLRWPAGKPRVLIEDPSGVAAVSDHSLFREAGFEVAVCSGPDRSTACPLVTGGRCELAESADVVLFGLDVDDPAGRDVLHAHLRRHAEKPVVVALRRHGDALQLDDAPATCTVLPAAASVGGQVRALRRAMDGGGVPPR
jgi:hypothetical protein